MVVAVKQAAVISPGHVLVVGPVPSADARHCRVEVTPPQFEGPAPASAPLD